MSSVLNRTTCSLEEVIQRQLESAVRDQRAEQRVSDLQHTARQSRKHLRDQTRKWFDVLDTFRDTKRPCVSVASVVSEVVVIAQMI